jgi:hypothetical protein
MAGTIPEAQKPYSVVANLKTGDDSNLIGWNMPCDQLTFFKDHSISILLQDNAHTARTVTLESKFTDLFVDGATFDKNAKNDAIKCYLPIFPNKLVSASTPAADQWFIGSKFLGKKTLVFDNVYQRD